jgi:hypothetical protein
MRLRQICLVADSLEPVGSQIEEILGLGTAHRDPNVAVHGLENLVWPVGGEFLEVVAPVQDNTAAGRYLARRGGPGGYMVILHCADGYDARQHIAAQGIRIAWEIDRPNYIATHFHPRDVGDTILSVDSTEAAETYAEQFSAWPPGGEDWRDNVKTDVVSALVGAEMQCGNPEAMAALWSKLLLLPQGQGNNGEPMVRFENGEIRFVSLADGRSAGLGGIDLQVADKEAFFAAAEARQLLVRDDHIILCGIRIYVH